VTDVIETSSTWLALREQEDARARSADLAAAAVRLVTAPLTVHDLGSGTGSMMRWLAPRLPGPQTWVLHDWNEQLVQRAGEAGIPDDADGRPVAIRTRVGELVEVGAGELRGASLVTASALLDVLTSRELHAMAAACLQARAPVLLSLSVTGRVDLRPWHRLDEAFQNAFNAHQRRSTDGRRLLGPHAVAVARGIFLQADWHVRPEETPWRLGPHDAELLTEWFEGWVHAAFEQDTALRSEARAYLKMRREQMRDGILSVAVHHRDLLAWPR